MKVLTDMDKAKLLERFMINLSDSVIFDYVFRAACKDEDIDHISDEIFYYAFDTLKATIEELEKEQGSD